MQSEERDEAWKQFCGRGYEIPDDPHDLFRSEDDAQSNETLEERVSSSEQRQANDDELIMDSDGSSARLTATSVNHDQGIWLERFRPAKEVVESMTELAKWQQILKQCAAIQDAALLRDELLDNFVQVCPQERLSEELIALGVHFDTEIEAAVDERRWGDAEDWQITKAAAFEKILTRFGMETGKLCEAYMSLQDSLDHAQAWNKTHSGPLSKTVILEDVARALMTAYNDPGKVPNLDELDMGASYERVEEIESLHQDVWNPRRRWRTEILPEPDDKVSKPSKFGPDTAKHCLKIYKNDADQLTKDQDTLFAKRLLAKKLDGSVIYRVGSC